MHVSVDFVFERVETMAAFDVGIVHVMIVLSRKYKSNGSDKFRVCSHSSYRSICCVYRLIR